MPERRHTAAVRDVSAMVSGSQRSVVTSRLSEADRLLGADAAVQIEAKQGYPDGEDHPSRRPWNRCVVNGHKEVVVVALRRAVAVLPGARVAVQEAKDDGRSAGREIRVRVRSVRGKKAVGMQVSKGK